VRIEQNDLIVSGERPAMLARGGAPPYMIERRHGHLVRAYPLPETVEAKIPNVEVRNGVLEVILRKVGAGQVVVATASRQSDSTGRSERVASAAFHQLKESVESRFPPQAKQPAAVSLHRMVPAVLRWMPTVPGTIEPSPGRNRKGPSVSRCTQSAENELWGPDLALNSRNSVRVCT
jgi:hypothetical protein